MNEQVIEVGDVVKLACAGPEMVVTRTDPAGTNLPPVCHCAWFNRVGDQEWQLGTVTVSGSALALVRKHGEGKSKTAGDPEPPQPLREEGYYRPPARRPE